MSRAQSAVTSGPPPRTAPCRWTARTRLRCGGCSGRRRARVRGLAARTDSSGFTFEAAHDGFRRLPRPSPPPPPLVADQDGLRVDDLITGRGRHEIVVRWQLAAGSAVRLTGGTALVTARRALSGGRRGHRRRC